MALVIMIGHYHAWLVSILTDSGVMSDHATIEYNMRTYLAIMIGCYVFIIITLISLVTLTN